MYSTSALSLGERLFIDRRRRGIQLTDMAKRYKVSTWRYQQWEHDMPTEEPTAPYVQLSALTQGECCVIARRRKRLTITELGRALGWSHVTVIKWEQDGGPLYEYWQKKGWPKHKAHVASATYGSITG